MHTSGCIFVHFNVPMTCIFEMWLIIIILYIIIIFTIHNSCDSFWDWLWILREPLIHSKTLQIYISSVTEKVLLVTPNISCRFLDDTLIPKLQVENTLYHKYIYTHSKSSWNAHVLIWYTFWILFSFLSLGFYMDLYSF
jgi:hypothetical protein